MHERLYPATTADVEAHDHDGLHVAPLPQGKPFSLDAYLDTEIVEHACQRMAEHGIVTASARRSRIKAQDMASLNENG